MKIVKSEKNASRAVIEIEVEKAKFQESYDKVLVDVAKDIKIPGFRPGKAPLAIVAQNINTDYANERALENIIKENYAEILKQSGLIPIDYPDWKILSLDDPCKFQMQFDVAPDVKLGKYKALEIKKNEKKIEDSQIDDYIKMLREDAAEIKDISDRAADLGDIAELDVEGRYEGKIQEPLTLKQLPILLGDNRISLGFDANIEGMVIGEAKTFKLVLPEDHYVKDFAGKEIEFTVKLNRLAQRNLPDFNDDFAKKISSFESAQDYRQDIKKRFEDAAKNEEESVMKDDLIEKVSADSSVEMPESLVNKECEIMLQEMEDGLIRRGLTIEAYAKNRKMTIAGLAQELKPSATARAKAKLILREIAKQENLALSEEEMNKEITEIAKESGKTFEEYKNNQNVVDYVEDYVLRRKALDFIVQNAK